MTKLIFLDLESYFDDDYSLRKMSTPAYILDDRFELQMVAVKEDFTGPSYVVDGPDFPKFITALEHPKVTSVCFNSLFDNSVFAWRYGFVPGTMLDCMGMARALLGHKLTSFSLNSVADYLGLGAKHNTLMNVKGMHRAEIIASGMWPSFQAYAMQDNELCAGAFVKLFPQFPWSERRLMDMVLRCAVQPRFVCDVPMLQAHLQQVRDEKEATLALAGVDKKLLMSNPKFEQHLRALGIDIQYKTTPAGRQAPAFAKTDKFMEELQDHPDPAVQALAAARLGSKSTIEETRAQRLIEVASLPWPANYCGGNMPVPLRYGGAHTHRLSGDWKMNMQNMPSSRKKGSKLRHSLKVPAGYTVITADLGQIEARLVAWICGASNLLDQFRRKLDPYAILATEIFGRPIVRKIDVIEGFIGKTGILGLGYGCGKDNFHNMVLRSARLMGIDVSSIYTRAIGDKAVDSYRRLYNAIPATWQKLQNILHIAWLNGGTVQFGPTTITRGKVLGPNGLSLDYNNPRLDQTTNELLYDYGKLTHRIYGPKLLENIVQFLARIVVMNAALRIRDRGRTRPYPQDYLFVLQAHDELVFIVHDDEVDAAKEIIHCEMTRPPSWASDIPLTADVNTGASYGESK